MGHFVLLCWPRHTRLYLPEHLNPRIVQKWCQLWLIMKIRLRVEQRHTKVRTGSPVRYFVCRSQRITLPCTELLQIKSELAQLNGALDKFQFERSVTHIAHDLYDLRSSETLSLTASPFCLPHCSAVYDPWILLWQHWRGNDRRFRYRQIRSQVAKKKVE